MALLPNLQITVRLRWFPCTISPLALYQSSFIQARQLKPARSIIPRNLPAGVGRRIFGVGALPFAPFLSCKFARQKL